MLQFSVIGNLGADARVEESNGRKFVSFSVGHNDSWVDASGNAHTNTQWVSCALNGDGGRLLPYLVKGRLVFVQGRGSARVYSSPKERRMVAGLNLSVDRIELVGGQPESVPRYLYDGDGVMHSVEKTFTIKKSEAEALGATYTEPVVLRGFDGQEYRVYGSGWVQPASEDGSSQDADGESDKPF